MSTVLETTRPICFDADPLPMYVYEGKEVVVQLTCHGNGLREEWDIEIVHTRHIDKSWHDGEWILVATTYGRLAMRTLLDLYLGEEASLR